MPFYVYRCEHCGAVMHLHHPFGACDDPHPCIVCGTGETHRVPQLVLWNWGGVAPHVDPDVHPEIADMLDERARDGRMAAYAEKKAARGETWP